MIFKKKLESKKKFDIYNKRSMKNLGFYVARLMNGYTSLRVRTNSYVILFD